MLRKRYEVQEGETTVKDGGQAFPAVEWIDTDRPDVRNPVRHVGMSLRDYFAAHAPAESLAAIRVKSDRERLAGRSEPEGYEDSHISASIDHLRFNAEVEAALRYIYADAMIKARSTDV
jgi:hypothetical protein